MLLPALLAIVVLHLVLCLARENDAVATRAHHLYPFAADPPDQDLKLMDIVLLASVDGKFHALNRTSGHTLWSMASPAFPSSVPPALGPLVRTTHHHHVDPADDDGELYIIEPQSGYIYIMPAPTAPLQRLAFSMAELVNMSPFSFTSDGARDRRVFVGRKETALFSLELETGRVREVNDAAWECPWDPAFGELMHHDGDDGDEQDDPPPKKKRSTEISIGRTDYHIQIHTRPVPSPSQKSIPSPPQNLSFSTYGPNNRDGAAQRAYVRSADDSYVAAFPNGEVFAFREGSSSMEPLWINRFKEPIVAVFDIVTSLTPSQSQDPFVLLQPLPKLPALSPHPSPSPPDDTNPNPTPNPGPNKKEEPPSPSTAYVGLLEETGSLFAMSTGQFPLVAFTGGGGAPPTPSDPTPSDVSDHGSGTDGDGAVGKEGNEGGGCRNGAADRRCLVGNRVLEHSGGGGGGGEGEASSPLSSWGVGVDRGMPWRGLPAPPLSALPWSGPGDEVGVGGTGENISVGSTPGMGWWTARWGVGGGEGGGGTLGVLGALVLVVFGAVVGKRVGRGGGAGENRKKVEERVREGEDIPVSGWPTEIPPRPSTPLPISPLMTTTTTTTTDTPLSSSPPVARSISDDYVFLDGSPSNTPVPILAPAPHTPRPPIPPTHTPDLDAPDTPTPAPPAEDPDDSDAGAGKRKTPRKKRRGKKKRGAGANGGGADEEGEGGDREKGDEVVGGGLVVVPSTPKVEAPVGSSLVVSDTILGFGSHGTVVFRGSLQGRAVAVKRLLQDFVTLASREVSILQESDDHPNVIRYYYQEAHANFLYIALELCPASLADIIESPDQHKDISDGFDPKRALRQITSGLRHLHALKIIHRDIKPQNILVSGPKKNGGGAGVGRGDTGHRMLISDFGLCKKLDVDQTSFLPTAQGAMAAGTVGWRAPEILRGEVKLDDAAGDDSQSSRGSSVGTPTNSSGGGGSCKPTRLTKLVDIFALGCLFYYTLTNGGHPFGDRFEREVNILKDVRSLGGLERFGEEGSEAVGLISSMLSTEASHRPDTTTCLLHPFFWDQGRRLSFLQDASDRFEIMCRDPRDPNLNTLEHGALDIVGHDWHSRLDKVFIENLGKFRKYDGKSVQDLLRALRNKKHHYQDLPENVKRHLGPMPEGFLSYFTRRFPLLFLHVHSVIASTSLRHESMFRSYFELAES